MTVNLKCVASCPRPSKAGNKILNYRNKNIILGDNVNLNSCRKRYRIGKSKATLTIIRYLISMGIAMFCNNGFTQSDNQEGRAIHVFHGDYVGGSMNMYEGNFVSLDGRFTIDPMSYFKNDVNNHPSKVESLDVNNVSTVTMTLLMSYLGVDGSEFDDEIKSPIAEGKVTRPYSGGRMNAFTWWFTQPNPNPSADPLAKDHLGNPLVDDLLRSGATLNRSKWIFPVVEKIPYYIDVSALENGLLKNNNKIGEFFAQANMTDKIQTGISRFATDLQSKPIRDHYSCPVWYEMIFFGYVDGFENGIATDDDMNRLPNGITFVPSISKCGGKITKTVLGCAKSGGTKIALRWADLTTLINAGDDYLSPTALHEIGHIQGLQHVSDKANLMYESEAASHPAITKEQCLTLAKLKKGSRQIIGYMPWE